MKEYEVTINETLEKTVTIEAESKEEAEKLIEEMYNSGDIVLDADDFAYVDFESSEGKEKRLDVLLVEPGEYAKPITIDAELAAMQGIVGGHIQALYYFNDVAVVCNDEGKINGMELNRAIRDESGKMVDIVAGTFFVCGLGEESFASLKPEQLSKYEKMFKQPETFLKMGKGITFAKMSPTS